jgi:molybdopterin-guanine dinucleotide biosynthesis protein A
LAQFADDGPFLNLNTPEDLARAEAILRGAA